MADITLEKIDIIRERTGVSYTEAKEALEKCDGNIVDSLIYLENKKGSIKDDLYTTKDEFIKWIKEIVKKGNVTRIRIKKEEKVIADVPVNAGLAAGMVALLSPILMTIGVVSAIVTKITIEIVKDDGSVEVVNKIIKNTAKDVKEKVDDITFDMKEKVGDIASEVKGKFDKDDTEIPKDDNVYQYTVKFEDVNEKVNEEKDEINKDDR